MQNKKIIVLVSFVIVLSLIIFLATFNKQKKANINTNQVGTTEVDMDDLCDLNSEEEIYTKAFTDKDKKMCQCFREEQKINDCLDNVNDLVLYERIISEDDLTICDGIKNAETKEACLNIGQAKRDYLEKMKKEDEEKNKSIPTIQNPQEVFSEDDTQ